MLANKEWKLDGLEGKYIYLMKTLAVLRRHLHLEYLFMMLVHSFLSVHKMNRKLKLECVVLDLFRDNTIV